MISVRKCVVSILVQIGITFPVSISYNRTPTLHQSASLLWPLARRISGAIYSTVPQRELDLPNSSISFDIPKSVSITYTRADQISKLNYTAKPSQYSSLNITNLIYIYIYIRIWSTTPQGDIENRKQ